MFIYCCRWIILLSSALSLFLKCTVARGSLRLRRIVKQQYLPLFPQKSEPFCRMQDKHVEPTSRVCYALPSIIHLIQFTHTHTHDREGQVPNHQACWSVFTAPWATQRFLMIWTLKWRKCPEATDDANNLSAIWRARCFRIGEYVKGNSDTFFKILNKYWTYLFWLL